MSASEILAELPKLSSEDLQRIWSQAGKLLEGQTLDPSADLLEAIDAGDASLADEAPVSLEEARQTVRSWLTR